MNVVNLVNVVKCSIKGCLEIFHIKEPVSPKARFICKNHPRSVQLKAVGRVMKKKDNRDAKVKFQKHQFDSSLSGTFQPHYCQCSAPSPNTFGVCGECGEVVQN